MSWDAILGKGGSTLQGHIRRRGSLGSWEYILDVGRYGAQRCQGCGAALLDRTAAQGELSGLWRAAA
jgi:hypothetical protein